MWFSRVPEAVFKDAGDASTCALVSGGKGCLPTDQVLSSTELATGLVELTVEEVNQRIVQERAVRWVDA